MDQENRQEPPGQPVTAEEASAAVNKRRGRPKSSNTSQYSDDKPRTVSDDLRLTLWFVNKIGNPQRAVELVKVCAKALETASGVDAEQPLRRVK